VTEAVTNKALVEIRIGSFLLYLCPLCLLLNSYGCILQCYIFTLQLPECTANASFFIDTTYCWNA